MTNLGNGSTDHGSSHAHALVNGEDPAPAESAEVIPLRGQEETPAEETPARPRRVRKCLRLGCDSPAVPNCGGFCWEHKQEDMSGAARYLQDMEMADLMERLKADAMATPENFAALADAYGNVRTALLKLTDRVNRVHPITEEDRIRQRYDAKKADREAERRLADEEGGGREPLTASMVDAVDLDDLPDPMPFIPGVLNRESYGLLTGRDGSMKTFVALDWALCLATGRPWNHKPVFPMEDRPKVLFLVGEGASGFKKRVKAWTIHRGVDFPRDRFTALFRRVNFFRDPRGVEELIQHVKEGGYGFVVIDHLRLISGGADGNGSDMGVVVDNVKRLVDATGGGSVLLIAHTDKGDRDTRGFSGIEDDSDTVWHAVRPEDDDRAAGVTLKNTKMKDESEHPDIQLTPVTVELGKHPRTHDTITSLVLRVPDPWAEPKNVNQERILAKIREDYSHIGASFTDIREALGLGKSTASRELNALVASGALEKRGQKFWPVAAPAGADGADPFQVPPALDPPSPDVPE